MGKKITGNTYRLGWCPQQAGWLPLDGWRDAAAQGPAGETQDPRPREHGQARCWWSSNGQ